MLNKNNNLSDKFLRLKEQKNAVLLAHYYQFPDIQEVADFVGDSLALAKKAARTQADIIVFAGVHFMAETAKILNPKKKVLLPDLQAGCSLAESCPPDLFRDFVEAHPDHKVVTYVNCSADIKAMSDVVCTSSNAERVIHSIPGDEPIIFAPDKNLGAYLAKKTGRDMLLWEGSCLVHEAFSMDKMIRLINKHPRAKVVAHPESEESILDLAHYVGSTSAMLRYVKESGDDEFIVATEAGLLHQMQQDVPGKKLIPAPAEEDNTCACSECAFMKMNTLEKVYSCLLNEDPEIIMKTELMDAALKPIEKMLVLSD